MPAKPIELRTHRERPGEPPIVYLDANGRLRIEVPGQREPMRVVLWQDEAIALVNAITKLIPGA